MRLWPLLHLAPRPVEQAMPRSLKPILEEVLHEYALPLAGEHGVGHWARVWENGQRLAAETGAQREVVALFAVLHDARRVNEYHDPEHGWRAAELASQLRGSLIELSDADFQLLYRACEGHTHEQTHANVTIQTCWDADRLDLGRVGIAPDPARLCTHAARQLALRRWADERASSGLIPSFVLQDWGIDLAAEQSW